MVQSKDEHIKLIMQKAQRGRSRGSTPSVASSSAALAPNTNFDQNKSNSAIGRKSATKSSSFKVEDANSETPSQRRSPYRKGANAAKAPSSSLVEQTRMPRTRTSQFSVPRTDPYRDQREDEETQQIKPTQSKLVNKGSDSDGLSKNGRQSVEPLKVSSRRKPTSTTGGKANKKSTQEQEYQESKTSQVAKRRAKNRAAQQGETSSKEKGKGDSEAHIWTALAIFFLSIYLILSAVSYLVYWEQDADIATFSALFSSSSQDALNWGGKLGSVLSNLIVGRWLGVMGLMLPFVIFTIGLIVIRLKSKSIYHYLWAILAFMMVGSLALGHFGGYNPQIFGSGLGGESGIFITSEISTIIGSQGTSLLMIFLIVAVLYFAFSRYIKKLLNRYELYRRARAERVQIERGLARERELQRLEAIKQRSLEMAEQRLASQQQREEKQEELAELMQEQEEANEALRENQLLHKSQQNTYQQGVNRENPFSGAVQESVAFDSELAAKPSQSTSSNDSVVRGEREIVDDSLILLEGGQYGYIMGYMDNQMPYYYYLDLESASLASVVADAVTDEVLELRNVAQNIDNSSDDELLMEVIEPTASKVDEAEPNIEAKQSSEVEQKEESRGNGVEFIVVDTHQNSNPLADEEASNIVEEVKIADIESQGTNMQVASTEDVKPEGLSLEIETGIEERVLSTSAIDSMQPYDPTADLKSYRKPSVDLLREYNSQVTVTQDELTANKDRIVHTLSTFGIKIDSIKATIGPTVTLYEIVPAPGVRISKIKNLEDDIALTLSALGIRIIAPIPGKGTIGIEVPNREKEVVSMHSVVCAAKFQKFKAELPIALGKTIQNETFVFDLAKMPHLLVAGATGQGKSVGLNAIITSLLYKKHPSELKFVLVDPKKVELTLYSKLEKHFLAKMEGEDEAIITDTQKVVYTLNSICVEMDARYDLLKAAEVRNIVEYNDKFKLRRLNPEKGHRFLPYFVVVVDEFADLIMTAGREIETPIARIAQLARAVGIHLIIATQRPTTNIITGVIKANFPARIAFRVTSMVDSRTILDTPGANQLIGKGDMLVSTGSELTRVQCAFVDTPEVAEIVGYIADQRGYTSAYELPEYVPESEQSSATPSRMIDPGKRDVLFDEVARFVVSTQQGSASIIQRKFSIGFARAGRLVDQLEAAGVVGRQEGSKARQVLIQDPISLEMVLDTND